MPKICKKSVCKLLFSIVVDFLWNLIDFVFFCDMGFVTINLFRLFLCGNEKFNFLCGI